MSKVRRINWKHVLIVLLLVDLAIVLVIGARQLLQTNVASPHNPVASTESEQNNLKIPSAYFQHLASHPVQSPEVDPADGFSTGWSIQTADGNIDGDFSYDKMRLLVHNTGSSFDGSMLYRDGIPLSQGSAYTLYLNVASTLNRSLRIAVLNADSGEVYAQKEIAAGSADTYVEMPFTMEGEQTFNGRIAFYVGGDGSSEEHTISFDNVRLSCSAPVESIRVNQVGYMAAGLKRCTFIYDAGDLFDVVDAADQTIVYTGSIVRQELNEKTGEINGYGDFSAFQTPGTYYIRSQIGVVSPKFTIAQDPYGCLTNGVLKMFSYQRCGMALADGWAAGLAHGACHQEAGVILDTDQTLDVTGGWHDAGDFGRYTKTGAKAVEDLLLAYMRAPQLFNDTMNGPDRGNQMADILDEARYELNFLFKMQDQDGGVFARVVSEKFPDDFTDPADDHAPLIVMPKETTSTSAFAGVMATAAIAYAPLDKAFADRCLKAAENAWKWLAEHPELIFVKNPEGYNAGVYLDDQDTDGRFFAAMALYAAKGDTSYLQEAKKLYEADASVAQGLSWNTNGGYGTWLYLTSADGESDDKSLYEALKKDLDAQAEAVLNMVHGNGYGMSLNAYNWGSNYQTANNGMLLFMHYDLTDRQDSLAAAFEQLSYLLGQNALNMCFVTGFGTYSPTSIHNRLALAKNVLLQGALVGGPDGAREDEMTMALPFDTPEAKVYVDSYRSYSTNETAIYYNSPLLALLTFLRQCKA